jgi:uncharacterized membrane protein YidH (DUF202 family)
VLAADPGVGNERTALAWQRTALSMLAGSAIVARLTFDRLGAIALVSVMVVAPLALWVFWEGRWRYRHDAHIIRRRGSRGGRAPLSLTVATLAIGCTEAVALVRE